MTQMSFSLDGPWLVGLVLAVAYFTYYEVHAFRHPQNQDTLSRFIWKLTSRWQVATLLMGVFIGALLTHFFWHWCPDLQLPGVGG